MNFRGFLFSLMFLSLNSESVLSETEGDRYIYTEIAPIGVAQDWFEFGEEDVLKHWREPGGITRIELPCDCPVNFDVDLCFLSVIYPFMVPTDLPERGVIDLEFEVEDGIYTRMKFQFDQLGDFSLMGRPASEVYLVNVEVRPAIVTVSEVERFFFVFDRSVGVLAYARRRIELPVEEGGPLIDGLSVLSGSKGLKGQCGER